jgi:hypothetical protein
MLRGVLGMNPQSLGKTDNADCRQEVAWNLFMTRLDSGENTMVALGFLHVSWRTMITHFVDMY